MRRAHQSTFIPQSGKPLSTLSELNYDTESNYSDYYDTLHEFNPTQYYWLFNPQLKFNHRFGFSLDEEVTPKDYLQMREINRKNLTKFLKRIVRNKQCSVESTNKLLETYDSMSTEQDYYTNGTPSPLKGGIKLIEVEMLDEEEETEAWQDEDLDREIKDLLAERRNGQYLPTDIVAHLEFFYNTLIMSHQTENPFIKPDSYPALLFQENHSPGTLLEIHRRLIFPSDATPSQGDSQLSPLGKKYDWYPNRLLESPQSLFSESPSPKKPVAERRTTQFQLQIKSFEILQDEVSPIKGNPAILRRHTMIMSGGALPMKLQQGILEETEEKMEIQ